jgi:subtilisin-like proprotein convertase family protein
MSVSFTVPECRLVTHIKVEVNIKRPVRQDSSFEVRDIARPVCAPAR